MLDVNDTRAEMLFCSCVQPSDQPTRTQIVESIAAVARTLGCRSCAETLAQEFGEHPEAAAVRMRWARTVVADTYRRPGRNGQASRSAS
jgi:hypothetical protein